MIQTISVKFKMDGRNCQMNHFLETQNDNEAEGMAQMLVRSLKRMGHPATYVVTPYNTLTKAIIDTTIDKQLCGNLMYVQVNVWCCPGIDIKGAVTTKELEDWLIRQGNDTNKFIPQHVANWQLWFSADGNSLSGDGYAFTLDIARANVSVIRKQLPLL